MSAIPVPAAEPMSRRHTLEALSGLLLVLFVAMLSGTVVSIALPEIIGSLNGTQTQYTWVVTATLLTATASTPIWGKLADLFNKKALIQAAIVLFIAGSIIAGFAQNTAQLIGARAFQGIGVGGLQALVQVAIAAMIPPRERGRYNGYLGGVMALATVGGPLLGGLIVDTTWLGWRWCFFIGVPIAVIALIVLQFTLRLPTIKRSGVKIDYLGASLITAAVSLLLVWITFAGDSFAWISWQTGAMVGGALVLFALTVVVEARAAEPVIPLKIVRQRTTALAILGSLAVGMAMFGGAVFLGQYFQIGRGYTPTEAGLLTIPMMAGVLGSSIISGRLITKTGKIKPYLVFGSIVLVGGFAWLGTIDHATSLGIVGAAMFVVGVGVGMTMQNLVLAVQNTTALKDIGAASSTVAFFRSLGGTIGVSVLGAILARQVTNQITEDFAAAGIPASPQGGGGNLNLDVIPPAIQSIIRAAYGDATGHIFLVSAAIAVVGVIAVLLLKPITLRTSLDLADAAKSAAVAADAIDGAPAFDQVNTETGTPERVPGERVSGGRVSGRR